MPMCPQCRIEVEEGKKFCKQCGTALVPSAVAAGPSSAPGRTLAVWTQGVSEAGTCDGSFDSRDYPGLTAEEAIDILVRLPVPFPDYDAGEWCPPVIGFPSGVSITRSAPDDGGECFLFPQERSCSLEEAKEVILEVYRSAD